MLWYSALALSLVFSFFFFSSRRRHTRFDCDWSSDVCSSDLLGNCSILAPFDLLIDQVFHARQAGMRENGTVAERARAPFAAPLKPSNDMSRSEERRVGKECRSRWSPYH